MSTFDLQDHLPVYSPAKAVPILALSLLTSWYICYLVHLPVDTRFLRRALWPVSVGAFLWGIITIDMRGQNLSWGMVGMSLLNSSSAAFRWGTATSPPAYKARPKPFFSGIRETPAFRAFNLMCDEARLITLSSAPRQAPPAKRGTLYTIGSHLLRMIKMYLIIDICSYPLYYFDPHNLGNPFATSADWDKGIQTISTASGLPGWIIVPALSVSNAVEVYVGLLLVWRGVAVAALASGLWTPEEWPEIMDRPYVSSSMNEFWGKRYHQLVKHAFENYAGILSFLPRCTYILRIFAMSAIYHMLVYHPFSHTFLAGRMITMFMLAGLGLELERQFYHRTGRRVGGRAGRIWTWSWLLLCGYFVTRGVAESGFLGATRRSFEEDRTTSAVEWVLYAAGVRPHPSSQLPRAE